MKNLLAENLLKQKLHKIDSIFFINFYLLNYVYFLAFDCRNLYKRQFHIKNLPCQNLSKQKLYTLDQLEECNTQ
ncbi:hypothetical protein VF14_06865 [Nostoc linckia z18]|uniref:Uncharacterized protein n=2 Tax=Nostoc linckia TaxID=92942 RepID=A0A9Q5ZG20_NOSLI|nr:hypothetical protein VF05_28265 [Nostoc linckia z3]PHJ61720.1 hypothetical protein VF02_19270 [Nostoc linckia z1]PHJ76803.1 hypothetical protein VF03_06810 [Nostoc linckia z2]PHJ84381.1 hypothetical protein VF06_09800 [Nostoc linckia z4]PHJ90987.1 hypothetical protein VF07_06670 [Nostoc linckia z6]PHJ99197.1 hypothetical protein VF04_07080 [Nostoc linckia z7]PHK06466.1 hypothetical protein VF08_04270 [Nostoc linckia z8]PHK11188.1 hypothetical protein VF09_08240 [Nostoc linckia z9]PHK1871